MKKIRDRLRRSNAVKQIAGPALARFRRFVTSEPLYKLGCGFALPNEVRLFFSLQWEQLPDVLGLWTPAKTIGLNAIQKRGQIVNECDP